MLDTVPPVILSRAKTPTGETAYLLMKTNAFVRNVINANSASKKGEISSNSEV